MTDGSQTETTLADVLAKAGNEGMDLDPLKQLLGTEKVPKAAQEVADHWSSLSKRAKGFLRGDIDWPANYPAPKRVVLQVALAASLVRNEAIEERFSFARSLILRVAEAASDPKATKTTPKRAVEAVAQYWMNREALGSLQQLDIAGLDENKANPLIKLVSKAYHHFAKGKSREKTSQARELLKAWIQHVQQQRKGLQESDSFLAFLDGVPTTTPPARQETNTSNRPSHSAPSPESIEAGVSTAKGLKAYRDAHRTIGEALDQIKEQAEVVGRLQSELATVTQERDAAAKELKQLRGIASDHDRVLTAARDEAQLADKRRLDVVHQLDAAMEERDALKQQLSHLKGQLDQATGAEKKASEALENAKAGSRDDVVRAHKTGKDELASTLAGKLKDRFKQIDQFLELDPSVDQVEAMRDQVRDLKNSLRASGVEIGG